MKYKKLNKKEEESVIIEILDTLLDNSIPFSGKHRKQQWEKGWNENFISGDITPKYFGKYKVNRLNGKFVWGLSSNYEQEMLYSIIDKLAKKYLKNTKNIYEFGCGTGHNLLRIKRNNPTANLFGLDWVTSSQKILKKLGIKGYKFDYFNPNYKIKIAPNSKIFTVASLEQTGKNYKKFISYLLKNKPDLCIHIEPIPELLDPTNLIDYLSIKYMEKRKYLSGYLNYLQELEKLGKIKIHEARRSGIGSQFIDGYSIIVWSPKK